MGELAPLILPAMGMIQSQQQGKAQRKAMHAQEQAQNAQVRSQYERQERDRKDALKRAQAQQRARFGALGVGGNGGSAQAVLNGLRRKSDQEGADNRRHFERQTGESASQSALTRKRSLVDEQSNRAKAMLGLFLEK